MPFKCCVPNCKGNYKGGPKVSTFSFPKDDELRKKWLKSICRENFNITNNSKVCELHFRKDEIEKTTVNYSESTGERLTASLGRAHLTKGAIPSQLPGCPEYLSSGILKTREEPEKKKRRIECTQIEKAIAESIETDQIYQEKKGFDSIDELFVKLKDIELGDWIINKKGNCVSFYYIEETPYPNIKYCVYVTQDLKLSVLCKDVKLKVLSDGACVFPMKVSNLNEIELVLNKTASVVSESSETQSIKEKLNLIDEILNSLATNLPHHNDLLEFLAKQLQLLNATTKNTIRCSWETVLFCGLLHSISPHAYKFLRSSGNLLLPSSSTIKRVCGKFTTDPRLEQDESTFLHYVASKYKLLSAEDKTVLLMLDEIHIKPYTGSSKSLDSRGF